MAIPKPSPSPFDDDLLRAAIAKDQAACEAIYASITPRLINFVIAFVRNPQDAQDVVQEAQIKIFNSLASFDPARAQFLTWCCLIARGCAIDFLRKHKRAEGDISLDDAIAKGSPFLSIATPGSTVESILAASQVIHDCLDQLPEHQRMALWLVKVEGMKAKEAAEQLCELGIKKHCTPNDIYQYEMRGSASMKNCIEEREQHR